MTDIESILKAATPRPWIVEGDADDGGLFIEADGREIANLNGLQVSDGEYEANAELIALAVSAFEAQRECISGLVELLRDLREEMVRAGWPVALHSGRKKAFGKLDSALVRTKELLK